MTTKEKEKAEDIAWSGGSPEDRDAVTTQFERYREANTVGDDVALQTIFSDAPEATYYNLNGFTYNGKAHWTKLWQYYKKHIKAGPGFSYDAHGEISGDLAVIWCHRKSRIIPRSDSETAKNWPFLDKDYMSRATFVFRREPVGWRIVHTHFSDGKEDGERPGGV